MKSFARPSASPSTPFGHAVVVGGSIAGLVAARVLKDHFARVTVIEGDAYPDEPLPRRGVPQGRHLHFVLARGRAELERLFPSLAGDLAAAGAVSFSFGRGAALHFAEGSIAQFDSDLLVRSCTRPLIDHLVRRCVQALGVTIWQGRRAVGLYASADGSRVAGVRVANEDGEELIGADLVVEACGRASRAPTWLSELGYPAPAESVVDSGLIYACRLYQPRPDYRHDWSVLTVMPKVPDQPRSVAIFSVEGGRWLVCIASTGNDRPPLDDDGYLAFARSLPVPLAYEALTHAEPLGPAVRSGATENRLRHYEKLQRFPDGLVLLGDAVCAPNPLYGQGITLATLGARTLGEELQRRRAGRDLRGVGRCFQRALAKQNLPAWQRATGADSAWPGTSVVPPPSKAKQMLAAWPKSALRSYAQLVMKAAAERTEVAREMMEISHMQRSALALLGPRLMLQVIAHQMATRKRKRSEQ